MDAECLENELQKDGSPTCTCGKETFGCSIHPNTRGEFLASMRASLVRTLAALGHKPGSQKEREAAFIEKCSELLMWYDPDTCSWKMSLPSSKKSGYKPSSKTLPRSGMMRDGRVYQHQQPVPRTTVIVGGVLQSVPTPTVAGNYNRKGASANSGDGLATWARMWPTPRASEPGRTTEGYGRGLAELVEGKQQKARLWPTPQARDYRGGSSPESARMERKQSRGFSPNLNDAVLFWPTPCSSAAKGSSPASLTCKNRKEGSNDQLDHAVMATGGGQLNPVWVEWLMNWPLGWTQAGGKLNRKSEESQQASPTEPPESKPSATDKCLSKPHSHG